MYELLVYLAAPSLTYALEPLSSNWQLGDALEDVSLPSPQFAGFLTKATLSFPPTLVS